MYKCILLAVDDSANSRRALEATAKLASGHDTRIVLLHTFHLSVEMEGLASQFATSPSYLDRVREGIREAGDSLLDDHIKKLEGTVACVDRLLEEGKPGPVIVDTAKAQGCDLIVVGKRGRGRLAELLMGSTSQHVLHEADVPVLVVP